MRQKIPLDNLFHVKQMAQRMSDSPKTFEATRPGDSVCLIACSAALEKELAESRKVRELERREQENRLAEVRRDKVLLVHQIDTLLAHAELSGAETRKLRAALAAHHKWHLEQNTRTPVFMGDVIGQIPAEEYQDSELHQITVAALGPETQKRAEQNAEWRAPFPQSHTVSMERQSPIRAWLRRLLNARPPRCK